MNPNNPMNPLEPTKGCDLMNPQMRFVAYVKWNLDSLKFLKTFFFAATTIVLRAHNHLHTRHRVLFWRILFVRSTVSHIGFWCQFYPVEVCVCVVLRNCNWSSLSLWSKTRNLIWYIRHKYPSHVSTYQLIVFVIIIIIPSAENTAICLFHCVECHLYLCVPSKGDFRRIHIVLGNYRFWTKSERILQQHGNTSTCSLNTSAPLNYSAFRQRRSLQRLSTWRS